MSTENTEIINNVPNIPDDVVYILSIETTKILIENQEALQKIQWTNGESNIDMEYSLLACDCCEKAWDNLKEDYPEYLDVIIKCSAPDIKIDFIFPSGMVRKDIELKSSKNTKMLGSTIKNLDINKPLIYCLRPKNNDDMYKIRCSQYHNAMGENDCDLFQDRTPRPPINFERMPEYLMCENYVKKEKNIWIEHYAKCAIIRLSQKCQYSWQDDFIKIIQKKTIIDFIKNTTPTEFENMKLLQDISNLKI